MSTILTVSNFVFPLITYAYVARVLTPVGTGKVAFVTSILQYFIYMATMGLPTYGIRECARVRDDREELSRVVQELLIISLISTAAAYFVLTCCVAFIPKLHEYRKLFLVMGIYIGLNTIGVEWMYKGLEEYSYITARSILFKCIAVALTFICIHTPDDYLWYGFISVFALSASYVCNFLRAHRYVSLKKTGSYNLKRHMKPIFTMLAATVCIVIYSNFDVSMLGFISTENEVGLYNSAYKIKSIILSLSTAITSVMIPRMAYYIKHESHDEAYSLCTDSARISLLLAVPVAVYCFAFAKDVILFLCGEQYIDAAATMRILLVCVLPLIATDLFGQQILIPSGREDLYSKSAMAGVVVNIVCNLLLIPRLGAAGAALGTLVTALIIMLVLAGGCGEYIKNSLGKIKYPEYIGALICGTLAGTGVSLLVGEINVFLRLAFTAIAFFAVYYGIMLAFKEPVLTEEITKLLSHIKRKKENG